jgi:hypothetical protein
MTICVNSLLVDVSLNEGINTPKTNADHLVVQDFIIPSNYHIMLK